LNVFVKMGTGKNWNEMLLMQSIKQLLDEAKDKGELREMLTLIICQK